MWASTSLPSNFSTPAPKLIHLHSDEATMSFKSETSDRRRMNQPGGRRHFLAGLAGWAAAAGVCKLSVAAQSAPAQSQDVSIENFSPAGKSEGIVRVPKLVKSDAEWRAQLSAAAY